MKDILAERDRILREAGFEDIEAGGTDGWLKGGRGGGAHGGAVTDHARLVEVEAAQTYHEQARSFLHRHNFDAPIERQVWELHAEGRSFSEIADELGISRSRGVRIVFKLTTICFGGDNARRGRRRNPEGYSRDAFEFSLKLAPKQVDALDYIASQLGVDHRTALRAAILAQAREMQRSK